MHSSQCCDQSYATLFFCWNFLKPKKCQFCTKNTRTIRLALFFFLGATFTVHGYFYTWQPNWTLTGSGWIVHGILILVFVQKRTLSWNVCLRKVRYWPHIRASSGRCAIMEAPGRKTCTKKNNVENLFTNSNIYLFWIAYNWPNCLEEFVTQRAFSLILQRFLVFWIQINGCFTWWVYWRVWGWWGRAPRPWTSPTQSRVVA